MGRFVFVGPREAVEALHGGVPHFRRKEAAWLQLPPYSPSELSELSAQQVAAHGYSLAEGMDRSSLQQALCATWPREVLAARNACANRLLIK